MKTHKDLLAWQKSIDFVTGIYKITKTFPSIELYGLSSQIQRAAVSIPSNIAEGATRKSTKEFIQFLYIALSSASEVDTQLLIARNLKYIDEECYQTHATNLTEISKMVMGLIKSIKTKIS